MGDDIFLKGLGFCDLLTSIVILLLHYQVVWVGWKLALIASAYLFIKGILFRSNLISLVDLFAGLYVIVLFFGGKTVLSFVIAFYLFQKAVLSLA
ncbi:hypothetical protein HY772_01550 [Candidatus Woesearchaeota archaeon]|nr:hypothetical protein [Candidatus Woesearchaeota archaeon]